MIRKESIKALITDHDWGYDLIGETAVRFVPNAMQIMEEIDKLPEEGYDMDAYQREVMRTAPLQSYTKEDDMLINGVMGLCGESGECMDIIKKYLYQGHELSREKLAEELGDVLYYVGLAAQGLGYSLTEIAVGNNVKLRKRFPDGFDADRSVNRAKYEQEETAHE